MSAISLAQANNAYITLAPPWSKRLFKLGRLAYPPGHMPPQLVSYAANNGAALARAQAVVQAHVINPPDVRARNRAKRKPRARRARAL